MHQYGYDWACGISGSSLSERQIEQIISRCDKVTLLMDSDLGDDIKEATAMGKLYKAVEAFEKYIPVNVVPLHADDPADMRTDDVAALLEQRVSSSLFRLLTPRFVPCYSHAATQVA